MAEHRLRRDRRGRARRLALGFCALALVPLGTLSQAAQEGDRSRDEELAQREVERAKELWGEQAFEQATRTLEDVLSSLELPDHWRVWVLGQLADYERQLDRRSQALERLDESESLLGDGWWARQRAYIHGKRGQIHFEWGILDVAAAQYARERELVDEYMAVQAKRGDTSTPNEYFASRAHRFEMLRTTERFDLLEAEVAAALDEPAYLKAPHEHARLRVLLGVGLFERERRSGWDGRALDVLREALADPALEAGYRPQAELVLAEHAWREGRLDDAFAHLAQARRKLGALRSPFGVYPRWAALSARLAPEREDATQEQLERERTRLREALERTVEAWSDLPDRPGGYGPLRFLTNRLLVTELVRLSVALDGELRGGAAALDAVLALEPPSTVARRLGAPRADLASIRDTLLNPGGGAILYLPGMLSSWAIAVSRESLTVHELASWDTLEPASDGFRRSRSAQPDGEHLARLLFPPKLRQEVEEWEELNLLGRDQLGAFPFEALPWGDEGTLGSAKRVVTLPSFAVGLALARAAQERLPARPGDVRLVVAPEPTAAARALDETLRPIPIDQAEAQELLSAYPADVARVDIGPAVGLDHLRAAAGTRVLQVLAHGVLDLAAESPAFLALGAGGRDGLVGAADLAALEAPPLVILGACRGGHEAVRRGDPGAGGLAGALLSAGARCVVFSRDPVELSGALRFSRELHRALAQGHSVAEAARRARCVEGAPSFEVVGLGHTALFPRRALRGVGSRLLLWGGGALALLLLAFVASRSGLRSRGAAPA